MIYPFSTTSKFASRSKNESSFEKKGTFVSIISTLRIELRFWRIMNTFPNETSKIAEE